MCIPNRAPGCGSVALTLWLDSPSRLAVVTKHVASSRHDWRRIKSQGKVSSSSTSTTSPTCSEEPNQTTLLVSVLTSAAQARHQVCFNKLLKIGRRIALGILSQALSFQDHDINFIFFSLSSFNLNGNFFLRWPTAPRYARTTGTTWIQHHGHITPMFKQLISSH